MTVAAAIANNHGAVAAVAVAMMAMATEQTTEAAVAAIAAVAAMAARAVAAVAAIAARAIAAIAAVAIAKAMEQPMTTMAIAIAVAAAAIADRRGAARATIANNHRAMAAFAAMTTTPAELDRVGSATESHHHHDRVHFNSSKQPEMSISHATLFENLNGLEPFANAGSRASLQEKPPFSSFLPSFQEEPRRRILLMRWIVKIVKRRVNSKLGTLGAFFRVFGSFSYTSSDRCLITP